MGPRTRAEDDPHKLRGIFRRRPAHQALPQAITRLVRKLPRPQALQCAIEAADRWARRPSPEELRAAGLSAVVAGPAGASVVAALAVLYTLQRWYPRAAATGDLACMAIMPLMVSADTTVDRADPLRTLALRYAATLLSRPDSELHARMSVSVRGQLAATWHATGDETRGRQARDLLREVLRDAEVGLARATTASDRAEWQGMVSQTAANLGQQLTSLAERDPSTYLDELREALALHDRALSDPARRADPARHYHSRRMRGGTWRLLALAQHEDLAAAIPHLDAGVQDLDEAIRLWKRHPAIRDIDQEGILLNRVNLDLARLRVRLAHADIEESDVGAEERRIGAELGRLAARTRHPGVRPLMQQARLALRSLRNPAHERPDPARLHHRLNLALAEVANNAGGPGHAALLGVVAQLRAFAGTARPLPDWAWARLGPVLGHADAAVVGFDLLTYAAAAELALVHQRIGQAPGSLDAYLDQSIEDMERRLADPVLTSAELRLFSAWLGRLAWMRMYSVSSRDAASWLVLQDRLGSSAFRAMSIMYGVDEVGDWKAAEDACWRTHLYRARWERDFAGWFLAQLARIDRWERGGGGPMSREDLRRVAARAEVHPPGLAEHVIVKMAEGRPYARSVDGWVISTSVDEAAARRSMADLRAELEQRWAAGRQAGWKPADQDEPPPAVHADEIGAWLASHPDTALIVAGVGLHVVRGSEVHSVPKAQEDQVICLVGAYLEARASFSWGSPADRTSAEEDLGAALTDLLDGLGAIVSRLFEASGGLPQRVGVLPRSVFREVPWAALSVGGEPLGQRATVEQLETLAGLPCAPRRVHGPITGLVGARGEGRGQALKNLHGALVQHLQTCLETPDRETTERAFERAAQVHVLAHGQVIPFAPDASGIMLDEADDRPENRLSSSEIRQMDLRGVRPVCLWACNSAKTAELPDGELEADEPGALDSAFLLGGAHLVIGALWLQYGVSTAMIAMDFVPACARGPDVPEADLLWRTIAAYRAAVAAGGPVALAMQEAAGEGLDSVETLARGVAAWRGLRDLAPVEVSTSRAEHGLALLGRVVPASTSWDVRGILAALRSPLAWAGWRVLARSKEVL